MDPAQASSYETFEQQLMNKSVDYLAPQAPLSLIVQQSLTYDSIDGQNFPFKLWFLINNPAFSDVLHWSRDGTAIVFPDDKLFVQKVLKRKEGKIFKTESLKSFVRQLNLYGFRKVMCDRYDAITRSKLGSMFDHECFVQGRPDLLEFVKRRCNVKMSQKEQEPTPNMTLESFLTNRNRSAGVDFEDRAPKRRLRFSPQGKENEITTSPLHLLQRMQAQPNESFVNQQSNYFSYLQSAFLYQNTNDQTECKGVSRNVDLNVETNPGLDDSAVDESSPKPQAESIAKDEAVKPIIVTLPKSIMMPTASHMSQDFTEHQQDTKMSLPGNLNAMFSPATPSEISLVTASYLTTPTSMLSNTSNFNTPNTIGLYGPTGPSPLSALCASLFSPFSDASNTQNSIHKATQTSGGPKALSILADQATKIENWGHTQNSENKNE